MCSYENRKDYSVEMVLCTFYYALHQFLSFIVFSFWSQARAYGHEILLGAWRTKCLLKTPNPVILLVEFKYNKHILNVYDCKARTYQVSSWIEL